MKSVMLAAITQVRLAVMHLHGEEVVYSARAEAICSPERPAHVRQAMSFSCEAAIQVTTSHVLLKSPVNWQQGAI